MLSHAVSVDTEVLERAQKEAKQAGKQSAKSDTRKSCDVLM